MSGFLALGDSYTIGEGVARHECWPAQLVARLSVGAEKVAEAEIVATTGWTTDELLQAIANQKFTPPYSMVSLLIGVNNQYRGRELDNYRDEFAQLLDFAIRMAAGKPARVMVVSIPDWATTPFARENDVDARRVAAEIDAYNVAARELSVTRGSHWIEVTALSRGPARPLLAADGLHPSAAQYSLWVDAIEPVARAILAAQA